MDSVLSHPAISEALTVTSMRRAPSFRTNGKKGRWKEVPMVHVGALVDHSDQSPCRHRPVCLCAHSARGRNWSQLCPWCLGNKAKQLPLSRVASLPVVLRELCKERDHGV